MSEKRPFQFSSIESWAQSIFSACDVPQEYGGPGLDKISECITVEELNRICVGIGASIMVQGGLATDPILHFGSEELKLKYLSPAVRGEKIGAFALTEPECRIRCIWNSDDGRKAGKGLPAQWYEDLHHERDDL